jgi:cell pole-organizing protein PopZ
MSEQTPESTANITDEDGYAVAESEPSMEDILASIRKIISDDADPVPLDGPGDAPIENNGVELSPVSNAPAEPVAAIDAEADPFDLDSLLGDLSAGETSVSQPETFAQSIGIGDMASLDDDLAIPDLDEDTDVSEIASFDQDQDDMERLMNELLVDMDEPIMAAGTKGPLAAAVVPQAVTSQLGKAPTATDDNDMDVVKSLMADLTDDDVDPSADTSSLDDLDLDLDAMMNELAGFDADPTSETEADPVIETESDVDDLDLMEDDIFESILEMTLEDEVEAFDAKSEIDPNVPSLADIAAAAEAEALVDPAVMVKSAAVLGAKTQKADIEAPVSGASVTPEPAKPTPSEMETPMPSALRSDAILDDVPEKASMSAFAELNQVVEDKAILSERGPRIGDLVQDALKPMLKEWLDANIQSIVERAVAKEVKRIADGK